MSWCGTHRCSPLNRITNWRSALGNRSAPSASNGRTFGGFTREAPPAAEADGWARRARPEPDTLPPLGAGRVPRNW
ncbi:MAG: hypothetical protein ACRDQU_20220 [Pseudonocardiaceae bacterium]